MADFDVQVIIDPAKAKQGGRQVRSELNSIETSADRMRKTIQRAFALASITLAVRQLIQLTDTYTSLQNRLKTVVSGQAALTAQTERLFAISQRTRSSFEGTVELYARVGLAAKELGRTQEELTAFTESLNQAILLSGASGAEAQAGLIQLSQGLASGALRGDELRSVLEQLPAVADVIARELGVTRGQLREMGAEGKISADIVLDAFKNARVELAERFAKTVPTVSQAMQVLRNAIVQTVGGFDQALGPSRLLAKIIITLAQNMEVLVRAVAGLAIAIGTTLAAQALPKAITGIRALTAAIAANPIGAIAVALTTVISLLVTFSDQISLSTDGVVTLQDYAVAAFELITAAVGPVVDAIQNGFTLAVDKAREVLAGFGLSFKDVLEAGRVTINAMIGYYVGLLRASLVIFKKVRQVILDALGSETGQYIIDVFKDVVGFLIDRFKAFVGFAVKAMELVGISVDSLWNKLNSGPQEVKFKIGPEGGIEEVKGFGTQVKEAFISGFQQDYVGDLLNAVTPAFEALQKRAREVATERISEQQAGPAAPTAAPARTAPTAAENEALKAQKDLYEQIKAPIEEYTKTLAAANALLDAGKISAEEYNMALQQTQLGGALQQLKVDLLPEGESETALLEQTLQERLDLIRQFQEAKLISEQEAMDLSLDANRRHNQEVLAIEQARYKTQLQATGQAINAIVGATKGYVSEQSSAYRALFAVSKGFAIAETTVAIAQGIANSAKLGWPANIVAIASTIAKTAGLISQIQSAQIQGFQNGGDFRVGGAGATDSQLVAFRASPNETVSVRTPGQQAAAQRTEAPAQEQQPIEIINVDDPGKLEDFMATPAGTRSVLNVIKKNPTAIRSIVG